MKDKKMGCGICLIEVFDRFVFEINIKMKLAASGVVGNGGGGGD